MDWKKQAKLLFNVPKPVRFGNPEHCSECAEHEQTLSTFDVDSIGIAQLGNPGWDPLCFSSIEGLIYYMPGLVRITLDTMDKPLEVYVDQLVFHLIRDGAGNDLIQACNHEQRKFMADFLEYLIDNYCTQIDEGAFTADDILRAQEMWRNA